MTRLGVSKAAEEKASPYFGRTENCQRDLSLPLCIKKRGGVMGRFQKEKKHGTGESYSPPDLGEKRLVAGLPKRDHLRV